MQRGEASVGVRTEYGCSLLITYSATNYATAAATEIPQPAIVILVYI